MSHLYGKGLF